MFIRNLFLLTFAGATLVACSETPKQQGKHAPLFVGQSDIYGLLEKVGGTYTFSAYRTGSPGAGTWVNLRTSSPMWDNAPRRCGKGLIKDRNSKVPDCDEVVSEQRFMEANFDGKDAAVRVVGAVFTMGLTLTGVSYDVKFNQEKFRSALAEASRQIDHEIMGNVENELARLHSDRMGAAGGYELSIRNNGVKVTVHDGSGFYEAGLDFKRYARLVPNAISPIPSTFEAKTFAILLEKIRAIGAELRQQWDSEIRTVGSRCESGMVSDFTYTMECPVAFEVVSGAVTGTARANILSRSFNQLIPRDFRAEDEVMALRFDGRQIGLINKSRKFVSVDSLSLYYDGKVFSLDQLKIALAPQATLLPRDEIRLSDLKFRTDLMSLSRVTKAEIQDRAIEFGFAIKYRVANTSQEQTLYVMRKYPLLNLIAQR